MNCMVPPKFVVSGRPSASTLLVNQELHSCAFLLSYNSFIGLSNDEVHHLRVQRKDSYGVLSDMLRCASMSEAIASAQ